MYPSPPASPRQAMEQQQRPSRERRAFSFPTPPTLDDFARPSLRRRSASLNSHPWFNAGIEDFAEEYDLGEQRLGGGSNSDDDAADTGDRDMDWSMNGGELVFVDEGGNITREMARDSIREDVMGSPVLGSENDDVAYGRAGLALSPRALRGSCGHCGDYEIGGLGLYVIEEDVEAEQVEASA